MEEGQQFRTDLGQELTPLFALLSRIFPAPSFGKASRRLLTVVRHHRRAKLSCQSHISLDHRAPGHREREREGQANLSQLVAPNIELSRESFGSTTVSAALDIPLISRRRGREL
jgi:hypothetical protein